MAPPLVAKPVARSTLRLWAEHQAQPHAGASAAVAETDAAVVHVAEAGRATILVKADARSGNSL